MSTYGQSFTIVTLKYKGDVIMFTGGWNVIKHVHFSDVELKKKQLHVDRIVCGVSSEGICRVVFFLEKLIRN